jgi:mRNA interferase RelE/StbE
MLKIRLTTRVGRFLEEIPLKHAKQLQRKLLHLQEDPNPPDSKKLKGYDNYLRADIGEYRIIYSIDTDKAELLVEIIGKRNDDDVYRKFRRILSH